MKIRLRGADLPIRFILYHTLLLVECVSLSPLYTLQDDALFMTTLFQYNEYCCTVTYNNYCYFSSCVCCSAISLYACYLLNLTLLLLTTNRHNQHKID